tara:strand:+ start:2125 stop:2967 length:843 start_codon:yes stop_codon:yes gene_type:complete
MKTPYLYFGRKGYYVQNAPSVSSNVMALTAITNANGGMLPIVKADSVDPTTLGYRVLHRAVDAVDDKRGTDYTTDFVTGELFSSATAWDADKNADDIQAGQVTNLTSASAFIVGSGDQVVTVGNNVAAGTAGTVATGITATTNDFFYVEEVSFNAAVLPIATLGADLCVPASSLIGIEPLGYTAGGGLHYDQTAVDKTRLIFKSGDADRSVDTVDIIHTGGKFKEVCEAMEDICNSSVYDEAVKVHYLDSTGQKLHNAFSSRGIAVHGVILTLGNRGPGA